MPETQDKKRKQDLGIFYTPQEVVNFIFQILKIWKDKEDKETKRWQSRKPQAHFPSVIDPACGEGVFLKTAITSGFTGEDSRFKVPYVWGIDLDKSVVERWEQITLLSLFHGDRAKMNNHFYHQNGLLPLEEKHLMYKNAEEGLHAYDAVVGNPPYGGVGLESITPELEKALFDYFIWKRSIRKSTSWESDQLGLLERQSIDPKEKERLIKFPIEILFLDRFIQLAKPGGWIAIIIPDGILTNSNSHFVREFISERTNVEAIVSLPRETFKDMGTNAKTSILFLRKLKEEEKLEQDYKVFLASVERINKDNFDAIVKSYEKLYNLGGKYMNTSDSVQITKDQTGKEVVMVRTEKTLKQITEEKPSSRWDPSYWHPKYDELIQKISPKFKISTLKELLNEPIIAPDHVRASKGESIGKKFDCEYRTLKDLMFTGLNYAEINYCSENAYERLKRSNLKINDILFAGSGIGAIGRVGIVTRVSNKSCVGDLFIIRKPKVNPFYILVFLLSEFGQMQIERIFHGIQSAKISTDEIGAIKVPVLPQTIQDAIKKEYSEMSVYHDLAMKNKKGGNAAEYKNNLSFAEKILKELIVMTEKVIKGERDDIN